MKRFELIILVLVIFTLNITAVTVAADIVTDASLSMFTGEEDSTFEGWRGFSKTSDNAINSNEWFTYVATSRIPGHVISNFPEGYSGPTSPTGTLLYNAMNFGSEYCITGKVYIYQNQIYIYFNTSAAITPDTITVTGGYRIVINRQGKQLQLQVYKNSSWSTLQTISTNSIPYAALSYELIFADGQLDFSIYGSDTYDYSLSADLTQDTYYELGYFGLGSNATNMLAADIHIEYNSQKVYFPPRLSEQSEIFNVFSVYPEGGSIDFWADLEFRQASDIKKATLIIDHTENHDLSLEGNRLSKTVGGLKRGMHHAAIVVEDKYGVVYRICEGRFFISDYYASPGVFSIADDTGIITASFTFKQDTPILDNLTAIVVVYNADGRMDGLYYNMLQDIAVGEAVEISVSVPEALTEGQMAEAFLCEDFNNPAPVSGVFTFK